MDERILKSWLRDMRAQKMSVQELINRLRDLPFRDLGFAKVDNHRALRCGLAEVVLCEGKTDDRVVRIAREILRHGSNLLATRATAEMFERIRAFEPKAAWHEDARCVTVERKSPEPLRGTLLIV